MTLTIDTVALYAHQEHFQQFALMGLTSIVMHNYSISVTSVY